MLSIGNGIKSNTDGKGYLLKKLRAIDRFGATIN
jgi:hypothetical protein